MKREERCQVCGRRLAWYEAKVCSRCAKSINLSLAQAKVEPIRALTRSAQ